MNKTLNAYCCLVPIGIYAAYSLIMQMIFDVPFMAKSMVLSIFPSAIYIICFWKLQSSSRSNNLKVILLVSSMLALFLTFVVGFVGNDIVSALIAGIAVHSLMAFIFAGIVLRPVTYRENTVLKDENSGKLYVVRDGNAHELPDNAAYRLNLNDTKSINLSGCAMSIHENNISFTPTDSSSNDTFSHGIVVNPSSGMPMVGGISGLDVHGNSWGTSFNEPSNTYDPGRGY